MSRIIKVLLAGESWISNSTHFKGWDFFSSTVYETGIDPLKEALLNANIELVHMPNHIASKEFPSSLSALSVYNVVILSDIGANTLLLPPDVWVKGERFPNRLSLLNEWVSKGGGFAMCGGYFSFSGIYAAAKYYRTPIEELLPVSIYAFDDRVEQPDGIIPEVVNNTHPVTNGLDNTWPYLLGFNELEMKSEGNLLAKVGNHPLLVVGNFGKGRTLAWSSDIGPHWCPEKFVKWSGYAKLWKQAISWLAG